MESTFFEPLARRSIRLLKLAQDPRTRLLSFSLRVFSLDEDVEYVALSYTWGEAINPADMEPVLEDIPDPPVLLEIDTKLDLNLNLQDALVHLFMSGYDEQFLWVDAICINQMDLEEKRIQVSLMGEIYSKAKRVVAWLGKDTTDWENYVWLHANFLAIIEACVDKVGFEELMQQEPDDPKFLAKYGVYPPGESWELCWRRYMRFIRRRRWFARAWVFQEIALAKYVVFQCGLYSMSWHLQEPLKSLWDRLNWTPLVARVEDSENEMRNMDLRLQGVRVFSTRRQEGIKQCYRIDTEAASTSTNLDQIPPQWYSNLQSLLYHTRSTQATDARDKVYANLGIASQALPLHAILPTQLRPNYSTSWTAQLAYASAAKLLLIRVPRLAILSYVEDKSSRNLTDLPSWVPDYSTTSIPVPLISLGSFNCWPFKSGILPNVRFSGSKIEVRGAYLDSIKKVCTPFSKTNGSIGIVSILAFLNKLHPVYAITRQSKEEALWRTMVANAVNTEAAPTKIREHFKDWTRAKLAKLMMIYDPAITALLDGPASAIRRKKWKRIQKTLQMLDESDHTHLPSKKEVLETADIFYNWIGKTMSRQTSEADMRCKKESDLAGIIKIMDRGSNGFDIPFSEVSSLRRLYITEKGYLGIGPKSMKAGDEIWMLVNACVPFVLRGDEEQGGMALMGESYLHGFMQGEMFEKFREGIVNVTLV